MKKAVSLMLLFLLPAAVNAKDLAFRLLDGYVREKEAAAGDKTSAVVTLSIGGGIACASLYAYFLGEPTVSLFSGQPAAWNQADKNIFCGSFGTAGLVTAGFGLGMLLAPPPDFRAEFHLVFDETDPALRESLAFATLVDLNRQSRDMRISAGLLNIGIPVACFLAMIATNIVRNDDWYANTLPVAAAGGGNVIVGILKLFFEKSGEELLYERYLSERDG
jgi:hypothetical protein